MFVAKSLAKVSHFSTPGFEFFSSLHVFCSERQQQEQREIQARRLEPIRCTVETNNAQIYIKSSSTLLELRIDERGFISEVGKWPLATAKNRGTLARYQNMLITTSEQHDLIAVPHDLSEPPQSLMIDGQPLNNCLAMQVRGHLLFVLRKNPSDRRCDRIDRINLRTMMSEWCWTPARAQCDEVEYSPGLGPQAIGFWEYCLVVAEHQRLVFWL